MRGETKNFLYKNNRLQQLRGFCYTAQFGNISRAAEHMGLTHSSVSLQIKALEDDLKISLFKRNGPNISLTKEGEKLLDISLPLIEGIQNIHTAFHHEISHLTRTEINIAANSTTLNFVLPKIVKEFLVQHPDIYIRVHYAEHEEAMEKIVKGEVDIAFLPRREHKLFHKDCEYTPLFYYVPSLITRKDHPLAGRKNLSIQEISTYELTLPAEDLRVIPNLYDIFPQHSIDKRLRVNFVNWETTRKYIEEGLAISISSDVIIGDNDTLMGTPLNHLFAMVDYGVVKKRKNISKNAEKFIEVAKKFSGAKSKH